jgi:hypothetical protein
LGCQQAQAQRFGAGINAGADLSMSSFSQIADANTYSMSSALGYGAGLDLSLRFGTFGLGTGVNLSMLKYHLKPNYRSGDAVTVNYSLSDWAFPLYIAIVPSIPDVLDIKFKLDSITVFIL